ncbi:MAG: SulP family inorganic anion transporter [Granulosicoccaceae bacterium]|jgi:MFS superfamily sulfate permease-like transporter
MANFFSSRQFIPFLAWIRELRDKQVLRADIIAGVTVALVLIPQSMAYASLAGLPAYYGLYAAFLPPIVASLFGSSRQLATGPVAVVSLLTAAALEPIATAGSDAYVAYAILLALMVGIFQMSLGLLRLGVLVNFLSHPVVMGFTNAAAIIIATSQLPKIFGVQVEKAEYHYETVWRVIVAAITETHMLTFIMAALAIGIMVAIKKYAPKLPGVLIAVIVTVLFSWVIEFEKRRSVQLAEVSDTALSKMLQKQQALQHIVDRLKQELASSQAEQAVTIEEQLNAALSTQRAHLKTLSKEHLAYLPAEDGKGSLVSEARLAKDAVTDGQRWQFAGFADDGAVMLLAGGDVVGTIPEGLPAMRIPTLDWSPILQLFSTAITIALIGFMEAISIAKAMAIRTRQRLDTNQELIGQGLANMAGSMFQSYAVSGSFSRSAVNIGAGAITGFSAVVTGLMVLVVLLWLTPLLYHLPQATLAAVIMMAVIGLVNIGHFKHVWQVYRSDGIIAVTTFVLTLAFAPHLENAIIIGVMLSLGVFLYRTMKPRVAILSRYHDGTLRDVYVNKLETCPYITVIRFDGSLYFANVSYFEDIILERSAEKSELKYIIVDGQGMNQIDSTGEEILASMTRRLNQVGVTILFANFKRQILLVLRDSGFLEQIGEEYFFALTDQAIDYAMEHLDKSEHDVAECPLSLACVVEKGA